jgi:TonB family protein
MSPVAEQALAECSTLLSVGEGSDAIMVLELYLQERAPEGLLLLALAQIYIMAGQGIPQLLPREGPAADVGDWPRNRARLLGRAQSLLQEAVVLRPDDSAVEYLLADIARARGDSVTARRAQEAGLHKCNLARSFQILRQYQDLNLYPAKGLEAAAPEYPATAARAGIEGEVQLDLLISPAGEVVQVEPVSSPAVVLTDAATAALREVRFAPARIGKYPIWSWYRVPVNFRLTEPAPEPDSASGS